MKRPRHVERGQGLMQYAACGVLSVPGIAAILLAGAASLITGVAFVKLLVLAVIPLYVFAIGSVLLDSPKVSLVLHAIMVLVMFGVGMLLMGLPRLTSLLYEGVVFVVVWLPLLWNIASERWKKSR